jgi:signal transduction histidine kinase/CheY-like chemotaxis protein/HPt (histidine-containing phosphotransfer) domain-containing protein
MNNKTKTGLDVFEDLLFLTKKQQHEIYQLKSILNALPGSIYWKDKKGLYLGRNAYAAEKMLLLSSEDNQNVEMIGKTDYDLFPQKTADEYKKNDLKAMQTRKEVLAEEEVTLPNAEMLTQLSIKKPLFDENGRVVGVIGNTIDISERKQMENELKAAKEKAETANKAKIEFLDNMRHDVRTPLTGIIGFADMIKDETKSPTIKGYADNLIAAGKALLDFLNDILESVKVATGEIPLLKKKFDPKALLKNIIKLASTKAKEKNLTLKMTYDKKIPRYLIGDPVRLHRILLELVSNALTFTNQGSVKLSAVLAKQSGHQVIVKFFVKDTGIGIPEDKQQDIYIQFKRLIPSYEGIYKGAGLGLSIVKQFLNDLKGEIYVKSTVGQGTVFSCILPFKEALLDESEDVAEIPPPSKSIRGRESAFLNTQTLSNLSEKPPTHRILIVEDLPFAAQIEAQLLKSLGNRVDVASTGTEALALFKQHLYNLVFMDIGLPDMDGYQTTREIRALEGHNNGAVPILALSAHTDTDHKKQCIEAGMNGVINKPLQKEQVIDILQTFIPSSSIKSKTTTKRINKKSHFKIEGPVFDLDYLRKTLKYSHKLVKQFPILLAETLVDDMATLTAAYRKNDWQQVQHQAHKIKGGALYAGAIRLKEVCSHLENYLHEGKRKQVPELYQALLKEVDAINDYVY